MLNLCLRSELLTLTLCQVLRGDGLLSVGDEVDGCVVSSEAEVSDVAKASGGRS